MTCTMVPGRPGALLARLGRSQRVDTWWVWIVLGLIGITAVGVLLPLLSGGMQRARHEGRTAAAGSALDTLDGLFNPGRFRDVDERRHEAAMPEVQHDGAPPRTRINLDRQQAIVHLPPAAEPAGEPDDEPGRQRDRSGPERTTS
jgi:Family of unknown function (DUF6191)